MKVFLTLALGCALCGGAAFAAGQSPSDTQPTQPDNTKVNKRDRSKAEPTADQAKEFGIIDKVISSRDQAPETAPAAS